MKTIITTILKNISLKKIYNGIKDSIKEIPFDKKRHVRYGFTIGLTVALLFCSTESQIEGSNYDYKALVWGVSWAFLIGAAKEFWDEINPKGTGFDVPDLICTTFAGVLGSVPVVLITKLINLL